MDVTWYIDSFKPGHFFTSKKFFEVLHTSYILLQTGLNNRPLLKMMGEFDALSLPMQSFNESIGVQACNEEIPVGTTNVFHVVLNTIPHPKTMPALITVATSSIRQLT